MKKIIILALSIFLITGCTTKDKNKMITEDNDKDKIEETNKYEDNNPVKVGFYDYNNYLITDSFKSRWDIYTDMVWINIFPTNEPSIYYTNLKDTWDRYKDNYNNINYKFGINISYTLKNGETTNLTLLKPSDNSSIFNYIQIYLYDGYNATTSWYSHIEDNQVTDNTVLTSIKLTASTYIDEIESPIILTVFTYDGLDDFDENNNYIGNSKHTIMIEKID